MSFKMAVFIVVLMQLSLSLIDSHENTCKNNFYTKSSCKYCNANISIHCNTKQAVVLSTSFRRINQKQFLKRHLVDV